MWTTRLSSLGWARFYAAQLGRFCGRDLIGYEANDANLYRYVADNPTNATDPNGLSAYGICVQSCKVTCVASGVPGPLCSALCALFCIGTEKQITEKCGPPTPSILDPCHGVCSYSCGKCGTVKVTVQNFGHGIPLNCPTMTSTTCYVK
ncbi:MAG: RHS repeat-associated core domain-containing protein [Pirellulaceae bacterium]